MSDQEGAHHWSGSYGSRMFKILCQLTITALYDHPVGPQSESPVAIASGSNFVLDASNVQMPSVIQRDRVIDFKLVDGYKKFAADSLNL